MPAFNVVVALPVLIFMFKETKGLTLEEIDHMFSQYSLGDSPGLTEKEVEIAEKHSAYLQEEDKVGV